MYDLQSLINHCTNIISEKALEEDAEEIKGLAEFFENDYLHKLPDHLNSQCRKKEDDSSKRKKTEGKL